jgi:deoxyribodipyrimidine photolyase-related protein
MEVLLEANHTQQVANISINYNVKDIAGPKSCPFNSLYWDFLQRNRSKLEKNPRLAFIYKTWDNFDLVKKESILSRASYILQNMNKEKI